MSAQIPQRTEDYALKQAEKTCYECHLRNARECRARLIIVLVSRQVCLFSRRVAIFVVVGGGGMSIMRAIQEEEEEVY